MMDQPPQEPGFPPDISKEDRERILKYEFDLRVKDKEFKNIHAEANNLPAPETKDQKEIKRLVRLLEFIGDINPNEDKVAKAVAEALLPYSEAAHNNLKQMDENLYNEVLATDFNFLTISLVKEPVNPHCVINRDDIVEE